MLHPIHRATTLEVLGRHTLKLRFADGTSRTICFTEVLEVELQGPVKDPALFRVARPDEEVQTIILPNGADFAPIIPHDGPEHEARFRATAG